MLVVVVVVAHAAMAVMVYGALAKNADALGIHAAGLAAGLLWPAFLAGLALCVIVVALKRIGEKCLSPILEGIYSYVG